MSDTQTAMREFRFLDDKRKGGGLSAIEEQRWIDLGAQLGMTAQQGYYAEDGLWYAYPPGYDPNTGQYYHPQPQYGGYAPPPPSQPYYDPNQQYGYAPQAPQYDPNTGQYYDPNQQYGYPQQPQAPYAPPQQWDAPAPHPQSPGEWPQNYDPNTGQYYDPSGYPPTPSQPTWVPPAPQAWQPPPPAQPTYVPPQPEPAPAPAPAAAEEDGPLEVGEDEVMEVTDDDVTLLDSSPPAESVRAPQPMAPMVPLTAEKPLTDPMGDLRSALSFDEPEPAPAPAPAPAPVAAPLLDVEPLLEATPEPVAAAAEPIAVAPEVPVDLAPEPPPPAPTFVAPPPEPLAPEPLPAVAAPPPEPEIAVDLAPEPPFAVAAPPPEPELPVDLAPEPPPAAAAPPPEPELPVDLAPEPPPVVATPSPEPELPVDLAPEPPPVVAAPPPEPELPVDLAPEPPPVVAAAPPEPEILVDLAPEPPPPAPVVPAPRPPSEVAIDVAPEPEMPSIMVADDLGAQSFTGAPRAKADDAEPELPPLTELNAMLGGAPQPPPPPPPSVPDPPAAPLVLTHVAPISATAADLYPQGIPAPVVPPPPPLPSPAAFDQDAIPEPRPSIPISIHVEEPVQEGTFDADPILEASVEPEPPAPPPAPSFAPSFDDIPVDHEPEPLPSTHTGFEASLGDLPPAIADAPPPPIIDVFANPSAPVDVFEVASAPAVVDFDVAIDDKPVPVEAPLDLSGSPEEKIELAKTSDFLDFPKTSTPEASTFTTDADAGLVESGTLATFANPAAAPSAGIDLPPDEPGGAVPLASNADFLGMSELNNTGESWQKQDNAVSFDEPAAPVPAPEPPEEDIIQGVALEEEEPIEAEIQAELADAVIEPEPWAPPSAPAPLLSDRAPLAIPPPAAAAAAPYVPPPPKPIPPPPPPAPTHVPGAPVRPASQPFAPPAKGGALFGAKGAMLHEEPGGPIIDGEHRVILHTVEGQVKRGVLRDTRLGDDTVGLEAQPGAVERIPRPRIKAIFFMLPAGQKAPAPAGDKLRVTFKDGRQLAGFSKDHRSAGLGFFVVPADNRTNTERIFIYRASVEKVAVD